MNKHAFLIICHKSDHNLEACIRSIDYPLNDIFLLVDKKSKNFDFEKIRCCAKDSSITFVPSMKIYWGGVSQIQAEMALFETAKVAGGGYAYYHILSGVDLCIKPQNVIHEFFDNNPNKLFIHFENDPKWLSKARDRIKFYWMQTGRSAILLRLNKVFVFAQRLFGVDRLRHINMKIVGGSNWCSLPDSFVEYLLQKKDLIKKTFAASFCSDEIFIQTIVANSEFVENVYDRNNADDLALRHIDWMRGSPYVFQENDFEELVNSSAMFARKFTYSLENKLVDMLLEHIRNEL